ncbi:ABC transporter ATP-binding protein [Dyadobacter sp. CY261]|uniref:ATP-binding cassette domain-containing protein n=1 Tax=Dyadobacter sp. CY261 TaxID=2907203 RepID=UPI001F394C89|nr:ABC transporter ATP-binding protein [Dyadobacter sp. CY261]MCF0072464.1 ABC transporter ATP-binding protein [Dyadobacter sp. CY261]
MADKKSKNVRSDEILSELDEIVRKLDQSIFDGFDALYQLVMSYDFPSSCFEGLILLKTDLNDCVKDSTNMRHFEEKMVSMRMQIDAFIEELFKVVEESDSQIAELDNKELRDYFVEKRQTETVFWCEDIFKDYPKFSLKNISFSISYGQVYGVIGRNANGKTTLLKIVAGILRPTSGSLHYPMISPSGLHWQDIKNQIAFVKQEHSDAGWIGSLKQMLHFAAAERGIYGIENINRVEYTIARLGLHKYQRASWRELSTGFKLRLAIARQLVWKPKLLILDEPLANLDLESQQNLLFDLRAMADSISDPMCIIFSSQNLDEIESVSDKIIFLDDGAMKFCGELHEIGDTSSNFFMLNLHDPNWNIMSALWPLRSDIIEISRNNDGILIKTSKSVTGKKVLSLLLTQNVNIKLFRDVSNSPRLFFTDFLSENI